MSTQGRTIGCCHSCHRTLTEESCIHIRGTLIYHPDCAPRNDAPLTVWEAILRLTGCAFLFARPLVLALVGASLLASSAHAANDRARRAMAYADAQRNRLIYGRAYTGTPSFSGASGSRQSGPNVVQQQAAVLDAIRRQWVYEHRYGDSRPAPIYIRAQHH